MTFADIDGVIDKSPVVIGGIGGNLGRSVKGKKDAKNSGKDENNQNDLRLVEFKEGPALLEF